MSAASTGSSGTPLAKKLGYRAGLRAALIGAPDELMAWLAPLPDGVRFDIRPGPETDLAHLFATKRADLDLLLKELRAKLKADAIVWASWPKKSAKAATDITEDTIREIALPLGFVDVKVCAVSEVWSGLKLVVRKELR
ncbi:hypothetical protein [Terrarubrum flagellatum]|uniref:hypothetical protein n=1 Tax=Terrirubrum flagellatum TaxID=2895980 RepID=UPI0031451B71